VKGFNLFAGKHKLNAHLIKTHSSLSYRSSVPYRSGHPGLRVIFKSGRYVSIKID